MASTGSRMRGKPSPSGADSHSTTSSQNGESPTPRRGSWYPRVWPSKAAPVTEVACESIEAKHNPTNVASISTPQLDTTKRQLNPSFQLTKRASASTRSLPADATTTRINITSDGSTSVSAEDARLNSVPSPAAAADKDVAKDNNAIDKDNSEEPQANVTGGSGETPNSSTAEIQSSGWLSWVYVPFTYGKYIYIGSSVKSTTEQGPEPEAPSAERTLEQDDVVTAPGSNSEHPHKSQEVAEVPTASQRRSWLEMWYGSSSSKGTGEPKDGVRADTGEQAPPDASAVPNDETDAPKTDAGPVIQGSPGTKPRAWSFFFRESPKDSSREKSQDIQAADATVAPASFAEQSHNGPVSKPDRKTEVVNKGSVKIKTPPSGSSIPDAAVQELADGPEAPAPAAPEAAASKQLQKIIPNQVLPQFKDTFALQDRPTLFQSIGRLLHYSKEPNNRHVYKIPYPPRIKRALAIGVHGYFPAPLIRSVLGQPTGTSVRFSNMAAEAIQTYTKDHGYDCEIEKIALEGEGRIAERVDLLWKLLLNYMKEIRRADFILIACHSQGVPVAIMLVAKLIFFGCINASRVGICAMAGVNLGPFADYRSRWISGSAGELFDFALPYSQVSKDYESALRTCVNFGVRISYIGSIDDQLVSLESSLFSPISHPYIYRAVFVDGRVHAPSFVSHLVGFALKLRNLGISDHGLIRELSPPLAGSLYGGEGHSRLYDEAAVYRLAIEFALETSTVSNAALHIKRSHPPPAPNPYILPFAMRGLLEEEYVRRELYNETVELLRQFDDWKPTSKGLKDVKYRLEGIRSKL